MHFCVIKSRTIKIFVAIVMVMILLAIPFGGQSSAQVFLGYSTRKVPIYNVDTTEKQVAISFDDLGVNPGETIEFCIIAATNGILNEVYPQDILLTLTR